MSKGGYQTTERSNLDGPPLRSKDWMSRMRDHEASLSATGVFHAPDDGHDGRSKVRRKITRLELGTYANDLEAAAAFLGRNRKSLGGYLVDGIAEKYAKVLEEWAVRRTFPIDLPFDQDLIGRPAHDAIHQLRAGNPHVAGPIAAYALDDRANSHHTGVRNQSTSLQTFFLRTIVALSWTTNPNRIAIIAGSMEGIPALEGLHHEVAAVIESEQYRRDTESGAPWFYLHELTAGFALCCELLRIVCNMFGPPGDTPALTREEQRRAASAVLDKYAHYQLAGVSRIHSSSRLHWNLVQLAAIANQAGEFDPYDRRPDSVAVLKARTVFVRGIAQLKRNYGRHFPAIKQFLDLDEDTGPLLRKLGHGELNLK